MPLFRVILPGNSISGIIFVICGDHFVKRSISKSNMSQHNYMLQIGACIMHCVGVISTG